MSKPLRTLIKYGVAIASCLAIGVYYLAGRDFLAQDLQNRYRLLSDAFSLPGLLCLFSGVGIWLSNEGAFNGLTWVVTYTIKSLIPIARDTRESYGDYVVRQRGKQVSGFGFLIIVGIVMIAISLIFLYLFNSMY